MAWKEPHPEIKNPKGFAQKYYNATNDYTNWYSKTMYDLTGWDPSGRGAQYDYYGKNIQRQYATDLNGAGQAQYTAAQNQIAEKYKQAKINSMREAQARGLQSSGFAQSQANTWNEKQINEESQIYADLLQQEQATLDTFYMQDKKIAATVAFREREETLARQQMFQDYVLTFMDLGKEIVSLVPLV